VAERNCEYKKLDLIFTGKYVAFFYNGVKSFLSHLRKNVGLGCSKVGC